MKKHLQLLILEDSPDDAELLLRELRDAGYEPEWTRVMTEPDFLAQLDQDWEIILADYDMPQFTGMRALELLKERGQDIPFVLISGTVGEDVAVGAMKSGASDYLMKGHLARLGQVIERELREAAMRRESRRLETAMNASEARYRRLFEASKDGILVLNGESGRIMDANPFLAELLGCAREELIGQNLWDPGFFKDIAANQDNFAELQAKDFIRYSDLAMETSDGRRIEVEFTSNAYQVDGHRAIQCNIRDITKRKQAEAALRESQERYQSLFDHSLNCVFLHDLSGNFLDANQAALDLLGFQRADIPTLKLDSLITEEQRLLALRIIEEIKTTGHQKQPMEFRLQGKDGRQVDVETQSSLMYHNGRPYAIQGIARDLTERKLAEHALAESEKKFRRLVQHMQVGLIEHGPDTRVLYWNPMAMQLLGLTPEQMQGKVAMDPVWKFIHEDGRDMPAEDYPVNRAVRAADGIVSNLIMGICRPGREDPVWVQCNAHVNKQPDGQIQAVVVTIADLTERKQAEMALQTSQSILKGVMDAIPVRVFWKDRNLVYLGCNPVFAQDAGFGDPGEVVGKDDFQLVWKAQAEAYRGDDRSVIESGCSKLLIEELQTTPDGKSRALLTNKIPLRNASGEIVGVIGSYMDITERKREQAAHAQLATAVEQAAETIVITDTEGTITYANPAFEQSTGYTCAEAIGQNPRVLKSGKQDAAFYRQMWKTIQSGEVWRGHFINQRKDGTVYEEEATISPIRNAEGKIINYVAVKRDVTHEVELEGQLRQAQKMEAIGTLAGGIAHDFNNILAIIFGYCNLLQLDLEGKHEPLGKVEEIFKAGHRAKDLVQQILTFSRQREQERQVIDLSPIVKETTQLLRSSLPANIEIHTDLAADAPAVLADATQIYQVVMNLGTNALHGMEGRSAGRLTVTLDGVQLDAAFIQTHPKLRAIQYARLTIADTGCGMDVETLERIYEPFFTTKAFGKGTGLGLAVVHGIVEAHDGVITVESQLGQGTTFRLYFPEQMQEKFLADTPEELIPYGQGERILMVDDEEVLAEIYQRLSKVLKYEGTVVTSPEEAVRLVRKNPAQYDLVITDLTMPGMNGLEMAREIREIREDLPIILATGFQGAVTQQQLEASGICELVGKPVSMVALAKVLRGILDKK